MPARGVPLVVSIQRSAVANAVEGHLASGVLVDRDRVVVPGPLGWLDDSAVRLEVLLASELRDGTGVVERIGIDQDRRAGPPGRGDRRSRPPSSGAASPGPLRRI
jgi:hypothetical protein